uniref:Uncharacterized protein n=1 Tax=Varanus komodoensis TaxID=61221 RepID=A0A8D2LMF7_VARKO
MRICITKSRGHISLFICVDEEISDLHAVQVLVGLRFGSTISYPTLLQLSVQKESHPLSWHL